MNTYEEAPLSIPETIRVVAHRLGVGLAVLAAIGELAALALAVAWGMLWRLDWQQWTTWAAGLVLLLGLPISVYIVVWFLGLLLRGLAAMLDELGQRLP